MALAAFALAASLELIPGAAPSGGRLFAAPAGDDSLAAAPLAPVFPAHVLDPPLIVTGKFGERRPRHFHAGLDLSIGGVVGKPVHAPMDGWIERVRTQGLGYGRSLYLHTADDRLVVLGHLDAFDEPIASYVAAIQDSTGNYDQDLRPARDRFRVRAGQRLAWAGRSGTGAPHLHVEVRRGDVAYNPLRAGIPARDPHGPQLRAVTIEPLDDASWVERRAGPLTRPLGLPHAETLLVQGRVRAIVRAVDPGERGASLSPWRLRETWGDRWIEWRADSASWVSDMADVDFVYDVGRAAPGRAPTYQLWAPAVRRPAMLATNAPDSEDAGLITVAPGDPPRPLRFDVEDMAGKSEQRVIWLRGPASDELGPTFTGHARFERVARSRRRSHAPGGFEFMSLPGGYLRVAYRGAPASIEEMTIAGARATRRAGVWDVVLDPKRLGDVLHVTAEAREAGGAAWRDSTPPLAVADARRHAARSALSSLEWSLTPRSLYEPATLLYDVLGRPVAGTRELAPISDGYRIEPAELPLRAGMKVRLDPHAGPVDPRAGLYVSSGNDWDYVGGRDAERESAVAGETRTLGVFAAMVDTLAPRITPLRPPRHAVGGNYSRWSLRARVAEFGSGLDGGASFFTVDGRRVPTDYDAPRRTLQWRPLRRPSRGTHRYVVEARDRAGNVRRSAGTFVLD